MAERGNAVDRISSLAQNVINQILDRLPIRDVAKACTLSRKWSHILSEYPHLSLDMEFFEDIEEKNSDYQDYYLFVVNRILLQHYGPISKFALYIPLISSERFINVDQWILFLSEKDVRELNLINSNLLPYKLPSYIFSYPELTAISVYNCIFKPPTAFKGFSKLTCLTLEEVTIESSVHHIPHLVILQLTGCRGTHILNISAPLLERLILSDNYDIKLSYYMECKCIEYASLSLPDEFQHHSGNERISLTGLFSCWSKLLKVCLDGKILKYMAAWNIPVRIPTNMNRLRELSTCCIRYDLDQMACIFCLLQSSLVLQEFEIQSDSVVNNHVDVLNYLKEVGRMNQTLSGLRIIKATNVHGSKVELLFVKLLLAFCPSLERMSIEAHQELHLSQRLSMARDLMLFPRASPKAEMILN